jgi:hypothetical protein
MVYNCNWQIDQPRVCLEALFSQHFEKAEVHPFRMVLGCRLARARDCNLTEAMILASETSVRNNLDRNISQSGVSMVVLTCGTGEYCSSHVTYRVAKHSLLNRCISCCMVALGKHAGKDLQVHVRNSDACLSERSLKAPLVYGCIDRLCYGTPQQVQVEYGGNEHRYYNLMGIQENTLFRLDSAQLAKVFGITP